MPHLITKDMKASIIHWLSLTYYNSKVTGNRSIHFFNIQLDGNRVDLSHNIIALFRLKRYQ